MDQTVINIAIGIAGTLGGFVLHSLWQAIKDLQVADINLTEKVSKIEVLVAGQYVPRDEFKRTIDALFGKLDKISDKLDSKADRGE